MSRPTGARGVFAVIATAALAALSIVLAPTAFAADTAYLRLAHLSPDTPAVDVYVVNAADPADATVLRGVGYGSVSDYETVDGGSYTISMRPAGAGENTPPVIATTLTAAAGRAYTVAGVGPFDDLGLQVLDDDLTLPPEGQSRVRVIQASASQPQLDISVDGGPELGTAVAFATTTPYETVPAGMWTLRVQGDTGLATTLPLEVASGGVYSVLILDESTGGLEVVTRVDAAAPATVPTGGVETGAGGTAPRATGTLATMIVGGLLAAGVGSATAGAAVRVRRRVA